MSELKKNAESLAKKAEDANDAGQALHFSQAALNVANAMCALKSVPDKAT